jgi:hypothetical protein
MNAFPKNFQLIGNLKILKLLKLVVSNIQYNVFKICYVVEPDGVHEDFLPLVYFKHNWCPLPRWWSYTSAPPYVQLKSGPYFNMSNLCTKIYNKLYYTTNLYLNKCWKWCPFISLHLSTCFTMFLKTFISVLSFTSLMAWVIFIFNCFRFRGLPSKFFKETLSTVGLRHRF